MTRASKRAIQITLVAAVTACFSGAVTGCRNNYEMPPPKPPINVPNARIQISLQTTPPTVRQMDPTTFGVRLSDAHGRPVNGASVTAALVMPSMDMGRSAVVMRPQGSGVYGGSGRFSMDGDWDVVVTATRGADRAVQTFPVHVR